MSGEKTFTEQVIEGIKARAESPEQAEEAIARLTEPLGPSIVKDAARRTNTEVERLGESKEAEAAILKEAQDQVDRFDNWWGKLTGQHAFAADALERTAEVCKARIAMIDERIGELQDDFDRVVEMEFERVSDPEAYAEKLETSRLAYEAQLDAEGVGVEYDTLDA